MGVMIKKDGATSLDQENEFSLDISQQAAAVLENEPELNFLLKNTVLSENSLTFEDAVSSTICYRLLLQPCNTQDLSAPKLFCPNALREILRDCMLDESTLENGHTMKHAVQRDALAVCQRDPATDSVLEVVLFSKGFAALVCHRAAYRLYTKRKYTALFLQSQASAIFGLDIHPRAVLGCGIMFDHGTGIVVGETAVLGDGCTLLHGVTLGGTGKDHGDRHPKVGTGVLIGANASILGNINIGDGAKIGAGSVVLRPIPSHATAVGAPAKIIGRTNEANPGSVVDENFTTTLLLHKSESSTTVSTTTVSDISQDGLAGTLCPYREYARLAQFAPPDTLTICELQKLCSPHKCSTQEIGACLFEMDTRNVGYVSKQVFREIGVGVLMKNTAMNEKTAVGIVEAYA